MKSKSLWIAAGVVFAAGLVVLVVRDQKARKELLSSGNSVTVADKTAAQARGAARRHIDVETFAGQVM